MTEVERDVAIEVVAPEDEREMPFSIGSRPATFMPRFTDEELRIGLGETYDQIERIFTPLDDSRAVDSPK